MTKKEEEAAKKKAAEEAEAAKKKAEEDAAAEAAKKAEEEKAEEEEGKKKKPEKTLTKAEADALAKAAAKKAVEDAQAKWEAEKDLSENERLKRENDELKAANRLRDAKDEVVTALTAAGSKSPDLAFDAIQGKLKFDDAGKLINSKDLIDGLKASYPDQFGVEPPKGSADGGAGGGDPASGKLTRAQLEKMTPQEVAKLDWNDVQAALTAPDSQ